MPSKSYRPPSLHPPRQADATWKHATPASGAWPLLGHAPSVMRRPLEFLESLGTEEDVVSVRLGRRAVYVLTSYRAVKELLLDKAHFFGQSGAFAEGRRLVPQGLLVLDGKEHLRLRRLLQPAFHRRHTGSYAEIIRQVAHSHVQTWRPGQVVSVTKEMDWIVITALAKVMLSSELTDSTIAEVRHSLPIIAKGAVLRSLFPHLHRMIPAAGGIEYQRAFRRLKTAIHREIDIQHSADLHAGNLLSLMLAARDEGTGNGMTVGEIQDQILTFLMAGMENTPATCSWAFHEIANNPDVAREVYNEADSLAGGAESVTELQHTERVVTETLRLHGVSVLIRQANSSVTLCGVHIPRGTHVAYSPYVMGRNPTLFPDPARFIPDRWLPERVGSIPRYAFVPFGAGAHRCIGDSLAVMIAKVIIAVVSAYWELTPLRDHHVTNRVAIAVRPNAVPLLCAPRKAHP
jgi:cytochrome P450